MNYIKDASLTVPLIVSRRWNEDRQTNYRMMNILALEIYNKFAMQNDFSMRHMHLTELTDFCLECLAIISS